MTKKIFFTILIGVFLAVNILFSFFSLRLDLSKGKIYSLSSASKRLLKKLDKGLTINFYASTTLPTRFLPLKRDVYDLLKEYERNSGGKIVIKVFDPEKDGKAKENAQKDGLPQLQFSQLEKDKYAITNAYFGIVLAYQNKKEIIPQLSDLAGLEYNLTAKIYKLTKKELPKILILGKNYNFNPQTDDLYTFKKIIGEQVNFELKESSTDIKLEDYSTVILFDNNQKEYTDEEKNQLFDYLKNGGKILAFVDGVWVNESLFTEEPKNNLFDFLKKIGIILNKNLILSTSAELVNFGNQSVQFVSPYPFWLKTNVFNEKSFYFNNIEVLTFPWVSSLELKNSNDWQTTPLVWSTTRSWEEKLATESGGIVLNPQLIASPDLKKLKSFILVAEAKNKNKGEIVLIPSTRFIQERYLSNRSNNLDFVLNILNEMASAGALSGISQRQVSFYLLPDLPEGQKDLFKYANIILFPLLFGIVGGMRLYKRSKSSNS